MAVPGINGTDIWKKQKPMPVVFAFLNSHKITQCMLRRDRS